MLGWQTNVWMLNVQVKSLCNSCDTNLPQKHGKTNNLKRYERTFQMFWVGPLLKQEGYKSSPFWLNWWSILYHMLSLILFLEFASCLPSNTWDKHNEFVRCICTWWCCGRWTWSPCYWLMLLFAVHDIHILCENTLSKVWKIFLCVNYVHEKKCTGYLKARLSCRWATPFFFIIHF